MPQRTPRPFRLAEALFLVAAAAVGLAWCRFLLTHNKSHWRGFWDGLASGEMTRRGLFERWALVTLEGSQLASAFLLPLTLAALALWPLGPRPRRRHLWCRPGLLAGVAVAFAVSWRLLGLVVCIALWLSASRWRQSGPWDVATELAVMASDRVLVKANAGGAVALVWLVAAATGRWRPEPSGLDRVGRGLGVLWVILSVIAWPIGFIEFLG